MTHTCAWPNCKAEGTFPAPRDPRNLGARQYFCQPHIKEFNKNWNGLSGFSPDEMFRMQNGGPSWDKPTWHLGLNGQSAGAKKAASPFANANDLFEFFQKRTAKEDKNKALPQPLHLPPDVKEACVIFNLEAPPPDTATLKKTYLALVKQHHPDVNKSEHAEDHIKRINVAYKILTAYQTR